MAPVSQEVIVALVIGIPSLILATVSLWLYYVDYLNRHKSQLQNDSAAEQQSPTQATSMV
jgi:hypothetical protein